MEIFDYFKAIGKRFWVLVLVPAVAGLLPLAYFALRPTQYAAHVVIVPTSLVGGVRSNHQFHGGRGEGCRSRLSGSAAQPNWAFPGLDKRPGGGCARRSLSRQSSHADHGHRKSLWHQLFQD